MRKIYGDIVLRDFQESDIEDEVRWSTSVMDWMALDTPWEEAVPADPGAVRSDMRMFFMMTTRTPESVMRPRLEIEHEGRHVGFVSSYFLDANWNETEYDPFQKSEGKRHAVGISICEPDARGKGIGTKALEAYLEYHRARGIKEVAIETWPGNGAMLRVAEKLGFRTVKEEKDFHERNGEYWDRLVLSMKLK